MNSKRPSPSPLLFPVQLDAARQLDGAGAVTYLQHRHRLGDAGAEDRQDLSRSMSTVSRSGSASRLAVSDAAELKRRVRDVCFRKPLGHVWIKVTRRGVANPARTASAGGEAVSGLTLRPATRFVGEGVCMRGYRFFQHAGGDLRPETDRAAAAGAGDRGGNPARW